MWYIMLIYIGSKVLSSTIDVHLKTECQEQWLYCTNDDCKEQMKRKHFENHIHNECESRIVECKFRKYGCIIEGIKASEMRRHLKKYKLEHLCQKFSAATIRV